MGERAELGAVGRAPGAVMNPEALAEAIVEHVERPLIVRIRALEARVATIERKPHVKFCGV